MQTLLEFVHDVRSIQRKAWTKARRVHITLALLVLVLEPFVQLLLMPLDLPTLVLSSQAPPTQV